MATGHLSQSQAFDLLAFPMLVHFSSRALKVTTLYFQVLWKTEFLGEFVSCNLRVPCSGWLKGKPKGIFAILKSPMLSHTHIACKEKSERLPSVRRHFSGHPIDLSNCRSAHHPPKAVAEVSDAGRFGRLSSFLSWLADLSLHSQPGHSASQTRPLLPTAATEPV